MSNYAKVVVGMSLGFALVAIDPWNIANAGATTSTTAEWKGYANNMGSRCAFKSGEYVAGEMEWADDIGNHGGFKTKSGKHAVVRLKAVNAQKVYVDGAGLFSGNTQIGATGNLEMDYTGSSVNKIKGSLSLNNHVTNSQISANFGTNTGGVVEIRIAGKAKANAAIAEEVVPGVNYTVKHVVTCEQ